MRAWRILAIISVALFSVAVPTTIAVYDAPVAVTFLIYTVLCTSILISPRLPWVATLLNLAGVGGIVAITVQSSRHDWPLSITGLVAFSTFIAVIGIWGSWVFAVLVWWAGTVVILAVTAAMTLHSDSLKDWREGLIVVLALSALVLGLSIALGQRQRIRAQLVDAQRDVEQEHARREYAEERGRIAREMHDVVVHSMSLVHMQASSAPYRLAGLDDETRAEFENIARSARSALREMRQVLGVLRPETDDAQLSPQPQLSDLSELATVTSRAGSPVTVSVDRAARQASSVLQLTCYRIVQEALSNAVRHAPGAAITARVSVTGEKLIVEVINGVGITDTAHSSPEAGERGGRGLRGMRERAEHLNGQVHPEPTAEGGFRVVAAFPFTVTAEKEVA